MKNDPRNKLKSTKPRICEKSLQKFEYVPMYVPSSSRTGSLSLSSFCFAEHDTKQDADHLLRAFLKDEAQDHRVQGGFFDECYKKLVLLHEDDEEPLLPDTTEADIETPETQTSACGQQRDVSSW
eukprot:CAMPEP_0119195778 /NCGR_PEP_ID=MMETSP1316-20130426/7260_1 /TAXON_ID=41880 /ORGANISM="Pycnococcus provasolii, Strain RCC2336" /LENGTH=124 /DNA_ID=CAMNT_0007191339 /DNA_START=101 /DNA_END=473 /DNA_ORIENTATION=-